ncbi:MAG: RluA family pseudouridine synthase [Verrucomicrobiota bacterium]
MSSNPEERTLLEWLSAKHPESPRKRLKEWITRGRIQIDGQVVLKPHHRCPDPGNRLSIGQPTTAAVLPLGSMPTRIHAQVNLLYIDQSLAIINKGPGLLSVPLPDKDQPSALNILESYLQNKGPSQQVPLPVHRLDQYTSGLLCFAMNPSARQHLVKQVRDHSFLREYLALADGKLEQKKGDWQSWFTLDEEGMHQKVARKKSDGATEAISNYEVIDEISWPTRDGKTHIVSKLRLRLKTGLKHQLRIHAARAGAPLLGDRHYHPDFKKAAEKSLGPPHGCKRQALHASSLGFIHPETGKTRRFNSKFPRDLAQIEENLRAKSSAAGK